MNESVDARAVKAFLALLVAAFSPQVPVHHNKPRPPDLAIDAEQLNVVDGALLELEDHPATNRDTFDQMITVQGFAGVSGIEDAMPAARDLRARVRRAIGPSPQQLGNTVIDVRHVETRFEAPSQGSASVLAAFESDYALRFRTKMGDPYTVSS